MCKTRFSFSRCGDFIRNNFLRVECRSGSVVYFIGKAKWLQMGFEE